MTTNNELSIESRAVHAGVRKNEHLAVVPPIYQTSTFAFESTGQGAARFAGEEQGYIYSRMGNPTVEALEKSIAALESRRAELALEVMAGDPDIDQAEVELEDGTRVKVVTENGTVYLMGLVTQREADIAVEEARTIGGVALPDTELISRLVDGFLIVVKAGHTRQARLEEALNLMTEDKVLGLVFNAVSESA